MRKQTSQKQLITLLNGLAFKIDFTKEDEGFIYSRNSKAILTYIEECFENTKTILEKSGVYTNYLILKIQSYIDLEFNYNSSGYLNTASVELANFDITSEIANELNSIEQLCIENPKLVARYSLYLNEKLELYFSLSENRLKIDFETNYYNLDVNTFIENAS